MEIDPGLSDSKRKGFIYTLEAVIASGLFLGMVITVIPGALEDPETETVQRTVHDSMKALDKTGELRDTMTIADLEKDIEPYVPTGYNYSVRIADIETETRQASGGDSFYFDRPGNYTEIQFWFSSASGLNVTFSGNMVIEDRQRAGYTWKQVSGSTGWLNFTGTGSAVFDFDTYSVTGEKINRESLKSVNYIVQKNGTKEIQVKLWR